MAYQIKSGETLSGIAQANNTDVSSLLKLNPSITNPNKIYAGQSLNLSSNTIPTTSLQSATPMQIAPPAPVDTAGLAAIPQSITDSLAGDAQNLTQKTNAQQELTDKSGQDYINLMIQELGKTADTQTANETTGVNTETANLNKYAQQLADLNSQASSLNREAQAIPLQTQENNRNTGATDAGVAPQNAGALRLNALKALSIGQQSDIAAAAATGSQLRLQAAKDKAQQIVDLKYLPIEQELAIKEKQYELNKDILSNIDKKRTEALGLAIDKEKTALADKKATEKSVQEISVDAAKFGANATVLKTITNAKTVAEALVAAKGYLTDPIEQAYKKAQIAALYEKTKQDIANNAPVSATTQNATISADAEDVLSGRNTLYNIRQTMGRSDKAAKYMLNLRDQIRSKDPQFDFIASDAGGKYVSSTYFQKAMSAIDSVLPNIDKVVDLSNQVGRVGVKGVDALLQKGALQIGNEKVSNFHQAQKLISDEIGVALGAGTVSDMKLQLGFDVTDPSVKPEVFASNMGIVKEFILNRKAGLNQQRYSSSTSTIYGGVTLPSGSAGSNYQSGNQSFNLPN